MTLTRLLYFFYQIAIFSAKHRFFAAFCIVLPAVVLGDIIFHEFLFEGYVYYAETWFGSKLTNMDQVDMGFAPEVWLAVLSMVLGTLIIVISIASQSTPKLIDLYMEDWASLFYIWFLIISGAHAAYIKLYGEIALTRASSRIFNLHFLLTISIILAFPYIFYILKYTKPSNIINKIFTSNLERIESLIYWRTRFLLTMPNLVEEFQFQMFEAMNQLDDLLAYLTFKEPKADIIQKTSETIQHYIRVKARMNPKFFKVSTKVRSDISFKTMVGQFDAMEEKAIFFEQKCFRLLSNMYTKMIEQGDPELASLCVAQLSTIGRTAIEEGDDQVLEAITVFFNTFMRRGINHGSRINEARNLYNAVFHYGSFVNTLVQHKNIPLVKQCFFYFRFYGQNIFTIGGAGLNFIIHVLADEMRKVLIQVYKDDWDMAVQEHLLNELLQVDMPPNFDKEELDRGKLISNGVRWVQIGLALFYMKEWKDDFVKRIITDILDDLDVLGEAIFRRMIDGSCFFLTISGPTFWEDTDRGNVNIYHTPDKDQIESFKQRVYEQMHEKLLREFEKEYRLISEESQLIVKLTAKLEKGMISELISSAELFEQAIQKLDSIDKDTLTHLVTLRTKLGFTSKNPDLSIRNTRQIAVNAELEISSPELQKTAKAVIAFSYLNYFYLKFTENSEDSARWSKMEKVTFHFNHPLQKRTYQFHSKFEGEPLDKHFYKVLQVENVEVIAVA
ncbi:MAG: hypothetical protein HQM13_12420 [SAR324 cluster bacterium]|nr:hypothetical protein [SAR324 cluster bacterium]